MKSRDSSVGNVILEPFPRLELLKMAVFNAQQDQLEIIIQAPLNVMSVLLGLMKIRERIVSHAEVELLPRPDRRVKLIVLNVLQVLLPLWQEQVNAPLVLQELMRKIEDIVDHALLEVLQIKQELQEVLLALPVQQDLLLLRLAQVNARNVKQGTSK